MEDPNRDTQTFSPHLLSRDRNNLCIGRLLANFVLVNVEVVSDLRTARARMRRLAARLPGAYLLFNRQTHQVLGKIERHAHV